MKRTLGRIAAFIMGVALMMADKWMLRGNLNLTYFNPLLAPEVTARIEMILYYIRLACSTDVVVPLIIIVSL